MGIPSDERFLRAARRRLGHLFPHLPERTASHKRRLRLSSVTEALIREFARRSPGVYDGLLLFDSTPVECARSRETVKRGGASSLADALANAADYGYCASHSRFFSDFRLHTIFALDGTPRALALTSPRSTRSSCASAKTSQAAAPPHADPPTGRVDLPDLARTCSPSSVTAPAPWRTFAPSPPRSRSTTASATPGRSLAPYTT